jgi:hypothetical protein
VESVSFQTRMRSAMSVAEHTRILRVLVGFHFKMPGISIATTGGRVIQSFNEAIRSSPS